MTPSHAALKRQGKRRMAEFAWTAIVLVILFFLIIGIRSLTLPTPYRQTIVVAGNPTRIVSWNATLDGITVIDVPQNVTIQAAQGYGVYPIQSLLTLDEQEHKGGTLFVQSMADAFGLPVSWYVDRTGIGSSATDTQTIRSIFSPGSVLGILTHTTQGSVPFKTWLTFVVAAMRLSSGAVDTVNLSNAFVPATLPDGSTVSELDPSRSDYMLGNAFLDSGLRSENLTIAVYNTTDVPSLGQKVARAMAHVGLQLVFVGNAAPVQSLCVERGNTAALASKTAQFIADYYHCNRDKGTGDARAGADISVYIGVPANPSAPTAK